VARAIAWIRDHYDEVIRVEDLAAEVGLSVSSLNRHFRAATSMSPVQYQKQIRLQRARIRLLANPGDVAGARHAVGYTSASQFNREYRRLFGAPAGRGCGPAAGLPPGGGIARRIAPGALIAALGGFPPFG
jgi:transcriptional regulator GlxA family with amidase domain